MQFGFALCRRTLKTLAWMCVLRPDLSMSSVCLTVVCSSSMSSLSPSLSCLAVWSLNRCCSAFCSGDALALPRVQCPNHPDAILVEDYRAGDMICPECGLVVGQYLHYRHVRFLALEHILPLFGLLCFFLWIYFSKWNYYLCDNHTQISQFLYLSLLWMQCIYYSPL